MASILKKFFSTRQTRVVGTWLV